jgi:hypothetical protein
MFGGSIMNSSRRCLGSIATQHQRHHGVAFAAAAQENQYLTEMRESEESTHDRRDQMPASIPYFLRTTAAPDGKGYATLDEARLAMDNLINRQSQAAISVTEQGDGKWQIRHSETGSIKIWIEDADGKTIRLK